MSSLSYMATSAFSSTCAGTDLRHRRDAQDGRRGPDHIRHHGLATRKELLREGAATRPGHGPVLDLQIQQTAHLPDLPAEGRALVLVHVRGSWMVAPRAGPSCRRESDGPNVHAYSSAPGWVPKSLTPPTSAKHGRQPSTKVPVAKPHGHSGGTAEQVWELRSPTWRVGSVL